MENFLVNHIGELSTVESSLRSLSYILPGFFFRDKFTLRFNNHRATLNHHAGFALLPMNCAWGHVAGTRCCVADLSD